MSVVGKAFGLVGKGLHLGWGLFENAFAPAHLLRSALQKSNEAGAGDAIQAEEQKKGLGFSIINRKNEEAYGNARMMLDPDYKAILDNFQDWMMVKDAEIFNRILNHIAFEYNSDKDMLRDKLNEACDVGLNRGMEAMLENFKHLSFASSDFDQIITITKQKIIHALNSESAQKFDAKFCEEKRDADGNIIMPAGALNLKAHMRKNPVTKRPFYKFW